MQRSQTVCESRVFCSLVGIETKAQLLDATQPLKIRRVDQTNHQPAFGAVVAQRNDVMNRIAINSLGQALETYSMDWVPQSITGCCARDAAKAAWSLVVTKAWLRAFTEFRTKTEFSDLHFARN